MNSQDMILVTGTTGTTGTALLDLLETRGAKVRALVRRVPQVRAGSASTDTVGDFR